MTNEHSHRPPEEGIPQHSDTNFANQEAEIIILEAIYDAVALRQGFQKKSASIDELDFLDSTVRAKRIFEKREK